MTTNTVTLTTVCKTIDQACESEVYRFAASSVVLDLTSTGIHMNQSDNTGATESLKKVSMVEFEVRTTVSSVVLGIKHSGGSMAPIEPSITPSNSSGLSTYTLPVPSTNANYHHSWEFPVGVPAYGLKVVVKRK